MDEEKVKCPYCGYQISNNIEQCPNCNEFFIEPNLSEFKVVSIPAYLVGELVLTSFGMPFLYSLIWILFNCKNICNIAIPKDLSKFKIILSLFFISVFMAMFFKGLILINITLDILLAYRILRIIEKFTLKKYHSPITHNDIGMIFFRTLYVIYYLDTYLIRVKDPNARYCLNIDKWFEYLIILGLLIGLLRLLMSMGL